ncbi:MAG: Lipopolysaccharide kinase (Kdo/WaaP) family [bacterium]|nr:MAG: Lipopolysaccharide kinase (Kdo/WaaP) family [bacterium]KAF0148261.1 MAG: Lipopolysaccharide kinase (Kdo/WaaP) family [bacterium]KAF0167756.1 MAG: Lipopolysaccharide kinase (Kdo/WaaP) family [bacterium]TXT20115.1 MAG: Lipopolysaccharide kinase (Kdo/WaaP) family [bacterium]
MSERVACSVEWIDPHWKPVLQFNGLADFSSLWNLRAEWFEPPNQGRGGWSGVARVELRLPEEGSAAVFLKRQENHGCRTWRHPWSGIPTFAREFANIQRLRQIDVPTLEPVYFAMDRKNMGGRAILVTRALDGYAALGSGPFAPDSEWARQPDNRRALIGAVADLARALHSRGLQHSCLYPKHLLAKIDSDEESTRVDVRLIDLEKLRRPILPSMAARHDLSAMHRHSPGWSARDRLRFLLHYLGERRLSKRGRRLWRYLVARSR